MAGAAEFSGHHIGHLHGRPAGRLAAPHLKNPRVAIRTLALLPYVGLVAEFRRGHLAGLLQVEIRDDHVLGIGPARTGQRLRPKKRENHGEDHHEAQREGRS